MSKGQFARVKSNIFNVIFQICLIKTPNINFWYSENIYFVFLQEVEQLCSTSTSTAEVHGLDEDPLSTEIPEFSPEPLRKEIGVQCCLDYTYVVTSTASTQTGPGYSIDVDTRKIANPSPSTHICRDEVLDAAFHDHSYNTSYHPSPLKSLPTVSPQKSEKSLFSDEEGKISLNDDDDDDFIASSQETDSTTDTEPENNNCNKTLEDHIKEPKYLVF